VAKEFREAAVLLEEIYALYTWPPCAGKRVIFIVSATPSLHLPRPAPPPSHLAPSLSQRYFYPPAPPLSPRTNSLHPCLDPPPHPVPVPPYRRDAAGGYSQKPRRHAVNSAEQAHDQRPPQWMRIRAISTMSIISRGGPPGGPALCKRSTQGR